MIAKIDVRRLIKTKWQIGNIMCHISFHMQLHIVEIRQHLRTLSSLTDKWFQLLVFILTALITNGTTALHTLPFL